MKKYLLLPILLFSTFNALASAAYDFQAENPVTAEWLLKEIQAESPRIMLTSKKLTTLKKALANGDKTTTLYYALVKQTADKLCDGLPPLERKKVGKRLLQTSREALNRITCLALAANIEKENTPYVERLDAELRSVCSFSDWNPGHFLDVAEMALAVSIGIDWCADTLPPETIAQAKKALVEKALLPAKKRPFFAKLHNNWNQVCNGGISAAAVAVAEQEPELAASTLSTALDGLPNALSSYYPDGIYPEGASYWIYGTFYSAIMADLCQSAFNTDFNLLNSPGFKESAQYARLMITPSGKTYNFFDCGNSVPAIRFQPLQAWFANQPDQPNYYNATPLNAYLKKATKTTWVDALALLWIVDAKTNHLSPLPEVWAGHGENPIAIFRNNNDPRGFYFGCKGGKASLSHGNMDAGSFILERDGVRWSVDLGMQGYTALEKAIGNGLWSSKQNSIRWTLLSKNNFGHSTLTVNDALHDVSGHADLEIKNGTITINLSNALGKTVQSAKRTITRLGRHGITIHDTIFPNEATQSITWSMMTQADVEVDGQTLHLKQDGKELTLSIEQPKDATIRIIPLDPPPLPHDMKVKNLKRIDITQKNAIADFQIIIFPENR